MSCIIKKSDCPLQEGETQCSKCALRPGDKFASREDRDEAVQKAEQLYSQNHAREAVTAKKVETTRKMGEEARPPQDGKVPSKSGVPSWAWGAGGVVLTIAVFMMMGKQSPTPAPVVVPAPAAEATPAPVVAEAAPTPAPAAVVPVVEAAPRTSSFADPFAGEMVAIPITGRPFSMGDNGSSQTDEKPAHPVTIRHAYELGHTEVTQGQWKAVMGNNPSEFKACGANCPVESVTWNDIQQFIRKLNDKTGKQYRLPTEAEWEYACRAGGTETYCGSSDINAVAWYESNSGSATHQVAKKQKNAFGLYDMSGNVWEWVQDGYHDNYSGAPDDGSEWKGNGAVRVLRGGSWFDVPDCARSANRIRYVSSIRSYVIGFRLARMLP